MIDGVILTPLKQICDERGKVMHMLRNDMDVFDSFGEIYFSCVYPGAIKGWHIHKKMILNYSVPHGHIKFVLYDERKGSRTQGEVMELFLADSYAKGKGCTDLAELMKARAVVLAGGDDDKLRELYEIQKTAYGGKE